MQGQPASVPSSFHVGDRRARSNPIPFNKPFIVGKELFYISQAVLQGQLAGNGRFTELCEGWMERAFSADRVLLAHSGTAALEMGALLTGVGPGDEVIMPSYTFSSTAAAFALRGASIRWVDIRPDTLNIDETKIEEAITERSRVIVPVHYAGVAAEMDAIMELARERDLMVVEDAAQGVCARYRGRFLGTIGDLGAYSFHETKNLISGEGGALVINRDDLRQRAEIVRSKGTNRAQFMRGEVERYTWVDMGSSYEPSEIIAAFLFAQLEAAEEITETRRAIHGRYLDAFKGLPDQFGIQLPTTPPGCEHTAHMFYLIMRSADERTRFIASLKGRGIQTVFHYVPLHSSPQGRRVSAEKVPLPVTDDLSARVVRLPCYFGLGEIEQRRVIEAVLDFARRARR